MALVPYEMPVFTPRELLEGHIASLIAWAASDDEPVECEELLEAIMQAIDRSGYVPEGKAAIANNG